MRATRFHLLHMITGVLIAVLLGIHMVRLHLDSILDWFGVDTADSTSWESMIARASEGLWAALYIALLAVALYHALYGLRGIILELNPSVRTRHIITWVLIIVGITAFIWGSYVPLALFST